MDIMKLATQLLADKFQGQAGANLVPDNLMSAFSGLIGGDSGGFDIGSLVSKFAGGGGLQNQVQSWLGDGGNESMSGSQLENILGGDKLQEFSEKIGVSKDVATKGLSDVIPQLVDKASSGGNLLESVGGVGGALKMAKGLFN